MLQNELTSENNIKNKIFNIRNKQVMLDCDLAILYEYANGSKAINLAVKRNIDRFPEDFCFQLTQHEYKNLRFQIETLNIEGNYSGKKYLPYAFTEQGVAMLASILRTKKAADVSINIMRAFVQMKKIISESNQTFEWLTKIKYRLIEHEKKFEEIFELFQYEIEIKQKLFFNGQIYDAHSLLVDIIVSANYKIIIIDNYIDKTVVDLLSKKQNNVKAIIISSNVNKISNLDIVKFNQQYPSLEIKFSNDYHDRFIIIDDNKIYHLGASLKDLGKKTFAINVIEDKSIIKKIEN